MAEISILLDNIRSVHNVGSIFRTAEGAGVSKLYLAETTPSPVDRFGRARRDLAKVALGAEKIVPWEYVESAVRLTKTLKKRGFDIIALEQDESSVDYRKIKIKGTKNILLIIGNEVGGVNPKLLKLSDKIAEIPMKGRKESLNVSVATGIMIFSII